VFNGTLFGRNGKNCVKWMAVHCDISLSARRKYTRKPAALEGYPKIVQAEAGARGT
jgi:hypothetical protein